MDLRAKVTYCVLLASATVAVAQNKSVIPVVDVSKAGAPVRVTGRVTAMDQPSEVSRYSFESDVEMTNVSSKAILLMVVNLHIVSMLPMSLNYPEEDDYFFDSKMLQPGSIVKLQRVLGRFGEPSRSEDFEVKAKQSARAKVTFVQFSDGSTWGDAMAAERLLKNRQLSLKQLETLKADYGRQSEEEFLKELLQPTVLQPIFTLQELYREERNLGPVLARLDDMLENAHTRSTQ